MLGKYLFSFFCIFASKIEGMVQIRPSFSLFLARRMIKPNTLRFSGPIVRISILSLALGLAVMLISVLVLMGFKRNIQNKLVGFNGHLHITRYASGNSLDLPPMLSDSIDRNAVLNLSEVRHLQNFVSKAAIIHTEAQVLGAMVKGVGADFDSSFFNQYLQQGHMPHFGGEELCDEVLVSEEILRQSALQVGDKVRLYFVDANGGRLRGRALYIGGVYKTGVSEFDEHLILADIRHLQKLNGWNTRQVSGVEVFLYDMAKLEATEQKIDLQIPYNLETKAISRQFPQIFDWLALQDMNIIVILVLVILIASVSMISSLLVLILEQTSMIGILKALGASNQLVLHSFLWQSAYIIAIGMFFGNLIGLGLGFLQQRFQWIPLDESTYYMSHVPIAFDWFMIALLNVGSFMLVLLFISLPAMIVSRMRPVKAIRFD